MNHDNRLHALDVGRALAILGVVAVHLSEWVPGLPGWLATIARSGQYGVQLFFVISAFTICMALEDDRQKVGKTGMLLRRFYVKRIVRIAPLYYVGIVVYGILDVYAARMHTHLTASHGTADVLLNVAFLHEFVPSAVNSVVPGGWSIGVEMAFYVVAPLLFLASRTRRGLWITAACVLFASYGLLLAGLLMFRIDSVSNNTFLYYWPPTQFPCFVLGFLMWEYLRDTIRSGRPSAAASISASAALGVGYIALLVTGVGMERSHAFAPVIAATAGGALLILLSAFDGLAIQFGFLLRLGEKSYGLYMWHFLAIFCFRVILKISGTHLSKVPVVLLFVMAMVFIVILAFLFASASERLIEKPVARWVRGKFLGVPEAQVKPHDSRRPVAQQSIRLDQSI
ncbi:acyltransferase [Burkholderia sp. Ac-20353]|nr:acyltransferase [Burkholderia sp. Ac-20353]